MPLGNGGVIGRRNLPGGTASGVWRLAEIESAQRTGSWPVPTALPVTDGLLMWLDANETSTLLTAVGGATEVEMNGQVSQWSDRSGSGRNATQATSANRPILATSVENGRRCVRFDGVNDFMSGTHGIAASSPHTFIAAFRTSALASVGNDKSMMYIGNRTNLGGYGVPYRFNSASYGLRLNGFDYFTPVSRTTFPFVAFSVRVTTASTRIGTASLERLSNTTPRDFYNFASFWPVTGFNNSFDIGRSSTNPTTSFTLMDVHEILIYNSSLDDSDVNKIVDYLGSKWGIAS
jgi:hypothetical protein